MWYVINEKRNAKYSVIDKLKSNFECRHRRRRLRIFHLIFIIRLNEKLFIENTTKVIANHIEVFSAERLNDKFFFILPQTNLQHVIQKVIYRTIFFNKNTFYPKYYRI